MLGVHQPDLAGRHAKEWRVETGHVIDETCPTGHDLAGRTWFRVEELVDIPAIPGHLRDRIPAITQQVPELIGIRGPWETRRVADNGETRGRIARAFDGFHGCCAPLRR